MSPRDLLRNDKRRQSHRESRQELQWTLVNSHGESDYLHE